MNFNADIAACDEKIIKVDAIIGLISQKLILNQMSKSKGH